MIRSSSPTSPKSPRPRAAAGLAFALALAVGAALLAPPAPGARVAQGVEDETPEEGLEELGNGADPALPEGSVEGFEAPPPAPDFALDPAIGARMAELEQVLDALGARRAEVPLPNLGRVPPLRELLLRARELERKADRLARERRYPGLALPQPGRGAGERELLESLERSLVRLRPLVPSAEGEPEASPAPAAATAAPAELLAGLLSAGGALDELAEVPPTAGDVFFAATRALAFTTVLRARAPGRRMPLAAPLEPVCTNDDVERVLADCWQRVEGLVERSGEARLVLAPPPETLQVRTGELLELASLLADELGFLQARFGDPDALPPACHPGDRRTAEVLQRVGLLQTQLGDVERRADLCLRARDPGASAP